MRLLAGMLQQSHLLKLDCKIEGMKLMGKIALYANTIRYLKPEQLWHQVTKRLGFTCPLIRKYTPTLEVEMMKTVPAIRELDYDEEFLSRFSVDELMRNEVTLLHSSEHLDLQGSWFFKERSPLWNHNLHYFEYLFALVKQYEDSKEQEYLKKVKTYITAWIKCNPQGSKNSSWECYPIALRLPNWIEIYSLLEKEIVEDPEFQKAFIHTLFEQYSFLLSHLEKHLLANHYFEDLKALVIASSFFGDDMVQKVATAKLIEQCVEQICEDGMQYERSPMYQKILLEDLIRVEVALESIDKKNEHIRKFIKKMLDVSFSLEQGLERLPLFNDCGKNITKSLNALVKACEKRFGITPEKKNTFPDSGFYIFEFGDDWKLIIDGGQPGPDYSPGHAHCEMMSFELFHAGKPVLVNCGTYAYQCDRRSFFRSTAVSNTVKIVGTEQSECWSSFRMARRSRLNDVILQNRSIQMKMTDYMEHKLTRTIEIHSDDIEITDESKGETIDSYLHFVSANTDIIDIKKGQKSVLQTPYAEEFGKQEQISAIKISGEDSVQYTIRTKDNDCYE